MKKSTIGQHAGIVWRTLNCKVMSWKELQEATQLEPIELALAIGWLARENKISFRSDGDTTYFETYLECYY